MPLSAALSEIQRRIVAAAAGDGRIVGVIDDGSGSEGLADEWSDLDVAVFVRDPDFAAFKASWKDWAAAFGPLLIAYGGRWSDSWAIYDTRPLPSRVDFSLLPESRIASVAGWPLAPLSADAMVLYDATGGRLREIAAELAGQSLAPADPRAAFERACGDFWYFALYVHSKLRRGEQWVARHVYESEVTDNLFLLLRLEAGAIERWRSRQSATDIARLLPRARLARLDEIVSGRGAGGIARALDAAVRLGFEACDGVTARTGWPWSRQLGERVLETVALPPAAPAMIDGGARAFIAAQRVARLATVDDGGAPHIVPVCFALEGSTLYTPVDEKPKRGDPHALRRLRNIAANPRVQVLFDVYDDADWRRLRYLQLRGTARIIEHGDEHARAVSLLRARYAQYAAMALESRPVIAVDVERVAGWEAG